MDHAAVDVLHAAQASIEDVLRAPHPAPLPHPDAVHKASESLFTTLPADGTSLQATSEHLLRDVLPGCNGSSLSPRYYGFVTGGITPAARLAESLVSLTDQNVSVHLPRESVATFVEDRALHMLLELLRFEPNEWPARVFTTGATAGNILGMGCAREFIISQKLQAAGVEYVQGESILSACRRAQIDDFQVLTTMPHSSLGKAANIVGLGSASVIDVRSSAHFLHFDMAELERRLALPRTASVVAISCGEVNSGFFATHSAEEVAAIRKLCDRYGAWLHVDGAFGIFARALPSSPSYDRVKAGALGLEHADSLGGDAHKLLNVPYDCGFFYSRHRAVPERVFRNANAAYLASDAPAGAIVSPLNVRLENSARFRGLPVYASLVASGRAGYADMLERMVCLARRTAAFVKDECPRLELLPQDVDVADVFMCVLFRARDPVLNRDLTERVKASRKIYGSGTAWEGQPACRLAIAKWDVDVERDFAIIKEVLSTL